MLRPTLRICQNIPKCGKSLSGISEIYFFSFRWPFRDYLFSYLSPVQSVDNDLKSDSLCLKFTFVLADKTTRNSERFTMHIYRKCCLAIHDFWIRFFLVRSKH